jgi:hypothetical protein
MYESSIGVIHKGVKPMEKVADSPKFYAGFRIIFIAACVTIL